MKSNSTSIIRILILLGLLVSCTNQPAGPAVSPTQPSVPTPSPTIPITPFVTVTRPAASPTNQRTESRTPEAESLILTKTSVPTPPNSTPLPPNTNQLPNPEMYTWEIIAEGFTRPLGIVTPPDGTNRLFVLEQSGLVYIIQDGLQFPQPFLDLRERASTQGSTVRGLLGLAFHPQYTQNGYFFVHYTQQGGDSVIARYQVSANPNLANPASETRLLEISYPIGEHLGGDLQFGPDGFLYIPVGDGGGGGFNDQVGNAQDPDTFLGAILRLDVDSGEPYGIPTSNPFLSGVGQPEVWAIGLRNPWRLAFDPLNGDLYIADVGENQREEINYLPAPLISGANFGWNYFEGELPFQGDPPTSLALVTPVAVYDHALGCSVTGGSVYRGSALPEWFGVYLYGDYCTGNIWGLLKTGQDAWRNELLFKLPAYITTFGHDQDGEIYLASITGKLYKLVARDPVE